MLLAALPPTANNQQLALASYQALPAGRVQTAGERRGAIGDQRSPIVIATDYIDTYYSDENVKPMPMRE